MTGLIFSQRFLAWITFICSIATSVLCSYENWINTLPSFVHLTDHTAELSQLILTPPSTLIAFTIVSNIDLKVTLTSTMNGFNLGLSFTTVGAPNPCLEAPSLVLVLTVLRRPHRVTWLYRICCCPEQLCPSSFYPSSLSDAPLLTPSSRLEWGPYWCTHRP